MIQIYIHTAPHLHAKDKLDAISVKHTLVGCWWREKSYNWQEGESNFQFKTVGGGGWISDLYSGGGCVGSNPIS